MPTKFTDIYDLFLVSIRDYKLDKLYNLSEYDFNQYLQGFLIKGLIHFDNCKNDLSYDLNNEEFNSDLSINEKIILSNCMTLEWLLKEINDVSQFSLHLSDKEFKTFSEAQNLKEKVNHRNSLREELSQLLTSYGLKQVDWSSWSAGNYS